MMKKTLICLILAGCFMVNPVVLFAADYYVSASSGNDANPGTIDRPWKTIGKANSTLQAGDTVYLRGGTYAEAIRPVYNGVDGKYVTFEGYQNETALFTGAFGSGASLGNKSYIKISKLNFGTLNNHWVDFEPNGSRNIIENCFFTATGTSMPYEGMHIKDKANYNTIRRCSFSSSACNPADLLRISNGSYNIVEDNFFGDASHQGLGLNDVMGSPESSYNVVRNNNFHNALHTSVEFYRGIYSNLFENNTVYDSGSSCGLTSCPANCNPDTAKKPKEAHKGLQHAAVRSIIRRNVFIGNGANSVSCYEINDARGEDSRFYYNTYHKNYVGLGIYGDDKNGPTLEDNNKFRNNKFKNLSVTSSLTYDINCSDYVTIANGDIGNTISFCNFWGGMKACSVSGITLSNNLSVDPMFTNAPLGVFTLQANSSLVDAGDWLTTVISTNGSGKVFQVADAKYFMDGWGIIEGDLIQLEGQTQTARITAVDYAVNKITVDRSLSWNKGQGVSLPYNGAKPDIGAFEYGGGSNTPPGAPRGLGVK